jgi:hypothetical protein
MSQSQASITHVNDVIYNVVNEIAEKEDVDPLELTPPLFDVIDSDALGQIFATTSSTGRMDVKVTFSYNGYDVTVCGDGCVSVEECEE